MSGQTSALMNTYARLPVAFERGAGAWLWDVHGTRYLDALSGIAVCGLGHAHPEVAQAIADQAATLVHTSNLYQVPLQARLADRLSALSGLQQAFFCNSGAEANEAAIKLARKYGHSRGIDVPTVVVADGSFHGRTLATLTATGNRKVQAGFEPLVQGFTRVPYNDLDALQRVAERRRDVVALLLEPLLGEGGIRLPSPDYLAGARAVCDQHGWLLMLDEIQTGVGRSGHWFASQHHGVTPDVMTLAKGLANGLPIGACLAGGRALDILGAGNHGSTFGGNPLACRAALATLDIIEREGYVERAGRLGGQLLSALNERLSGCAGVVDIRGQGLLIGIELDRPCTELVERALERRLLINVTADRVVRLLPPLVMSDDEAGLLLDTLCPLIVEFCDHA
ncbi:aspartate aminotransferase family protein [Immundisolibacter sp.]|uniref:aspartate aminotransferase family protein n=1 Tax=Immundisolibacter sp. TaxID=1934948 RepID=UPI000EEE1792|nr:aspartate aminotransferase family protein [Gammaproteobacteria bacterium]